MIQTNKLLNFVPATNSVASTGLPTLRQPISKARTAMTEREHLDFYSLSSSDQDWFLSETWCETCSKADLGIKEPKLYIENGIKHIEGKCNICNALCVSKLTEHQLNE